MLDNSSSCISPPCPCPPSFTASSFLRQHAISGHSAVECGGLSRRDTGAFSVRVLLLLSSRLVSLRTFKSLAGTRLVVMRCHVNACGRRVCAIIRCVLVVGGAGCPPCPCLVGVCGLWLAPCFDRHCRLAAGCPVGVFADPNSPPGGVPPSEVSSPYGAFQLQLQLDPSIHYVYRPTGGSLGNVTKSKHTFDNTLTNLKDSST